MATPYPFVDQLASRLEAARKERRLSVARLGKLAGVDGAQAWRICRGDFATLNPGVLKICNELGVTPRGAMFPVSEGLDGIEAQLATEAVAAWDRTEAGAQLVLRVLRALRPGDGGVKA